jgi:hypothetical protein
VTQHEAALTILESQITDGAILARVASAETISGVWTHSAKLNTAASAAGGAGFNLPHGAAPSAPVNGDLWTTSSNLVVRISANTYNIARKDAGESITGAWTFTTGQTFQRAAASQDAIHVEVAGDSVDRLTINADGKMEWGPGGASALDTNLYRSSANVLKTDDALVVGGVLTTLSSISAGLGISAAGAITTTYAGATSRGFGASVSGDGAYRYQVQLDGKIEWGNGTAAVDTNLYRSAANVLKTDDSLIAAGSFAVGDAGAITADRFFDLDGTLSAGGTVYGGVLTPSVDAATATAVGLYARMDTEIGAFTVDAIHQLQIGNVSKGAGTTVTEQVGLYIETQNQGASNYAIKTVLGTVQFGDTVEFGSAGDTNLYRGAADTLKTDDTFQAAAIRIGTSTFVGGRYLRVHGAVATTVLQSFTNSTTGDGATDGTVIGITDDEEATFWNYENTSMIFATNSTARLTIAADGGVSIPNTLSLGHSVAIEATGGGAYKMDIVGKVGGWARGLDIYDTTGTTRSAMIGVYGTGSTVSTLFMAHGTSPWSTASAKGLWVTTSGAVIVSTNDSASIYTTYRNSDASSGFLVGLSSSEKAYLWQYENTDMSFATNDTLRLTITAAGVVQTAGELDIGGDLNHDGSNVGFYGTAPVAQSAAYTPTNVTADRAYNADSTTLDEVADVLGTVISDLQAMGLLG